MHHRFDRTTSKNIGNDRRHCIPSPTDARNGWLDTSTPLRRGYAPFFVHCKRGNLLGQAAKPCWSIENKKSRRLPNGLDLRTAHTLLTWRVADAITRSRQRGHAYHSKHSKKRRKSSNITNAFDRSALRTLNRIACPITRFRGSNTDKGKKAQDRNSGGKKYRKYVQVIC